MVELHSLYRKLTIMFKHQIQSIQLMRLRCTLMQDMFQHLKVFGESFTIECIIILQIYKDWQSTFQTNKLYCPWLGRLVPGGSITVFSNGSVLPNLNLIWCAAKTGSGASRLASRPYGTPGSPSPHCSMPASRRTIPPLAAPAPG